MNLSKLMHESTQYPNCKGYIKPNTCEKSIFYTFLDYQECDGHQIMSALAFIGILAGLYPKNLVPTTNSWTHSALK